MIDAPTRLQKPLSANLPEPNIVCNLTVSISAHLILVNPLQVIHHLILPRKRSLLTSFAPGTATDWTPKLWPLASISLVAGCVMTLQLRRPAKGDVGAGREGALVAIETGVAVTKEKSDYDMCRVLRLMAGHVDTGGG